MAAEREREIYIERERKRDQRLGTEISLKIIPSIILDFCYISTISSNFGGRVKKVSYRNMLCRFNIFVVKIRVSLIYIYD